jgi:hypothetical protein
MHASSSIRLLLESAAPHRVVHHNGAYEAFLLKYKANKATSATSALLPLRNAVTSSSSGGSTASSNKNQKHSGDEGKTFPSHTTTMMVGMEYDNLNAAVEDLFAGQLVVLHPVQAPSSGRQAATMTSLLSSVVPQQQQVASFIITHYLVELGPAPPVPQQQQTVMPACVPQMPLSSTKSLSWAKASSVDAAWKVPAQAIG